MTDDARMIFDGNCRPGLVRLELGKIPADARGDVIRGLEGKKREIINATLPCWHMRLGISEWIEDVVQVLISSSLV